MRLNKELARLTEEAKKVEWPAQRARTFMLFWYGLHDALKANGISANGMDYDESTGHFWWQEAYGFEVAGHPGTFERTVYLDPKLPIAEEITRLLGERAAIEEVRSKTARRDFFGAVEG